MIAAKDIQKLFHDLVLLDHGQFFISEYEISVGIFDQTSKVSLSTPIYFGGNYIPKSVRVAITKTPPFEKNQTIKTSLTVDEENYRIFLSYIGATETLTTQKFQALIEDFHYLAEEWKIYLDEHDKNDLVYIHAK